MAFATCKLQGYSEGEAGLKMDTQSCGDGCRMSSMIPLPYLLQNVQGYTFSYWVSLCDGLRAV